MMHFVFCSVDNHLTYIYTLDFLNNTILLKFYTFFDTDKNNYIIEEPEYLSVAIIQCHCTIDDWKTIDNDKNNYYATVMTLEDIYDKPHRVIIGNRIDYNGIICKPCVLPVDNFV